MPNINPVLHVLHAVHAQRPPSYGSPCLPCMLFTPTHTLVGAGALQQRLSTQRHSGSNTAAARHAPSSFTPVTPGAGAEPSEASPSPPCPSAAQSSPAAAYPGACLPATPPQQATGMTSSSSSFGWRVHPQSAFVTAIATYPTSPMTSFIIIGEFSTGPEGAGRSYGQQGGDALNDFVNLVCQETQQVDS